MKRIFANLISAGVISGAFALSLYAPPVHAFGARPCSPQGSWRVVDNWVPPVERLDDKYARPRSAASGSKATFIAGEFFRRETGGYRWLVRRSLDRGETWTNVDEFSIADPQDTTAVGVTVDQLTDEVYVAGSTLFQMADYPSHEWIIRKSADHGNTWKTVDDITSLGRGMPIVRGMASGLGIVYAGGIILKSLDESIPRDVILRRSTDNGKTWATTDLTSYLADLTALTVASDGSVWVAGKGRVLEGGGSAAWTVIYSENGRDAWKTVDVFPTGTELSGIVASPLGGRVSAFGVSDRTTWTVREAGTASPGKWTTIDSYRPVVIDGKGLAIAGAATYARPTSIIGTVGNLYVTGQVKFPAADHTRHMVRKRKNAGAKSFVISDNVEEIYSWDGFTPPWAATTTEQGDILMAEAHPNPQGPGYTAWMVHKLTCR